MNHIYKSIFNKALGVFTAVPEFASAHGKGSERTVVGRVAKGTAGFAASALAISVGLALTSTNAVAAGAPGIYVNNSNDPACMAFIDDINVAPAQIIYGGSKRVILPDGFTPGTALSPDTAFNLAGRNPCVAVGGTAAENHDTQTNRTLFYNDKNLTLGGRLDVNSGIIGVGDRGTDGAGATNSIRMGTGTTLDDANKKINSIAIGVNTQATSHYATAIGEEALANGSDGALAIGRKATANATSGPMAIGYDAVTTGKSGIAQGYHAHTNAQSGLAIGDNAKASGIGQVAIGYASNAQKADIDKAATAAPNKADYAVTVGHYAGADYTGTNNIRSTLVGDSAGRYGEEGTQNTAVGAHSGMYVKGSNNVALGMGAGSGTATDKLEVNSTTAIGYTAKALTNDSIAIGTGAKSGKADKFSGERSVAIGAKAEALGTGGIAIGDNAATTDGHNSVAIGVYSKTQNEKAISIGAFNKATGAQSIVIAGNYDTKNSDGVSTATAARATVIGAETNVSGEQSVAIGDKNNIASARTYAMGNNINAAAGTNDSLAFGTKASVGGANAIALGNTAKATKENTIAQGTESVVYGKNSVSIGYKAVSGIETPTPTQTNAFSVSIGNETEAIDASTIAIGDKAKAKGGVDALAVGTQANAMTYKALAIGAYSQATGRQSTVIGNDIQGQPSIASGTRSQILGVQSNVSGDNSVSIGDTNTIASARTYAIGNNINAAAGTDDSLAFGTRAHVSGANQVSIGTDAGADNTSAGEGNTAGISIGNDAGRYATAGKNNTSIGQRAGQYANGDNNVAIGKDAGSLDAAGAPLTTNTVSIGSSSKVKGQEAIAVGNEAEAISNSAIAIGNSAKGRALYSTAIGLRAKTSDDATMTFGESATAVGHAAAATRYSAAAFGHDSFADGESSVALGYAAKALGTEQIAIGAHAGQNRQGTQTGANFSVAIGRSAGGDAASALGNHSGVSVGLDAGRYLQDGSRNTAVGGYAGQYVKGSYNVALGHGAGSGTATEHLEASETISIGHNSKASAAYSTAIGTNANAAQANSVALGAGSTTSDVHTGDYTLNGSYTAAGLPKVANGTVSVGAVGKERQIQNVAAGVISATSTDAINGSQLYATNNYLSNLAGGVKNVLGGDAAVDNAGNVTMSNIGGTGKGNVNDAIAAANTKVAAGENITVTPTDNADGSKTYTVATKKDLVVNSVKAGDTTVNTDGVTIAGGPSITKSGINANGRKVTGLVDGDINATSTDAVNGSQLHATNTKLADVENTANTAVQEIESANPDVLSVKKDGTKVTLTPNVIAGDLVNPATGKVNTPAAGDAGKLVTAGTVAKALAETHFVVDTKATTGGELDGASQADQKIKSGNKVTLQAGKNLKAKQTNGTDGAQVEFSLKDSISLTQVTAGDSTLNTDGLTIAGGPSVKKDGINAGNKKITGVANGNVAAGSTDAVNGGQLAEVKSKADSAVQNVVSTNPTALTATKAGDTVTLTPNFIAGDLVNADGTVNDPAAADEGKLVSVKTVADALKANHFVVDTKANGGTVDAASEENAKVGSGNKVTFEAGKNLVAQQTNTANGGATVNYKLSDKLENLVSVKSAEIEAGIGPNKVVLNNNGVKVGDSTLNDKGLTINNGPSVTDAGIDAGNKKITGVADGNVAAGSTDAVNGGQLAEVKAKADSAVQDVKSGDENALTAVKDPNTNIVTVTPKLSGDLVDTNGNITAPTTPADKGKLVTAGTVAEALANTHFVVDTKATDGELDAASQADQKIKASNKVTLQAGKNLKAKQTNGANGAEVEFSLKDSISLKEVKVGEGSANEVVLNNNGVNVAGNTYINKDGLNANDKKITNVAPGAVTAASKDAVNGSQLYNVADNVKDLIGPDAKIDPATGKVTVADPAKGIGETGKGNIGDAIKHVNDAAKAAAETAAKHTTVVEGKNVKVTKGKNAAGGDEYTVATKDDLDVTSVTAGNTTVNTNGLTITGGPSVTRGGIDAGNRVISGVKAGDVSATSQEAVNGSQLHATNTKLDGVKAKADTAVQDVKSGDENALTAVKDPNTNIVTVTPKLSGDLVDANGNITAPTTPEEKGKLVTAGTVADALANTHFVVDTKATDGELDAASQADQKIKAGNKVTLQAGKNLKAKQTNGANGAQVEFSLKDSISLTQVTAGTGDNQVVLGNNGVQVGGNTYINKDGLNANGNKVTNVADGVNPNDAVNKGQLDAVKGVADSAVKSVNVANGEQNLVVDNTDPKNPKLSLKKDLTVDSVKAGDSTLNTDGLTIAGGPSVKKDGINAGNKKITGVADGNVAAGSTDAVNGGQLYNVANNVKDLIGPDATIDPATGKVTVADPAQGIAGTGKGTIGEAIKSVKDKADTAVQDIKSGDEKALSVTKAGNTYTITPNLSGDLVDADGNITAPATDADKGKLVTAGTVADALANTHFVVDTKATDGELDAASQADQKIKAGNKVTLQAGKNLKAKQTNGTDGAQVEFSLKDSISLTQVTAGEGDNQVVLGNDGVKVGGNTYINKDGLNANSKVISNVADGVNPNDAVNKGQLDAVKGVADSAVKSVDVVANENNLVVDNTDPKNPKLRLRKAVDLDSIKLENNVGEKSFLNSAGLTIKDGPAVTRSGINANNTKVTNVTDGDVNGTSKDAVNGSQLYNVASNVKDLIGPDAAIDPATGKVTVADPTKGIGGTGKGNIGDAIQSVKDAADKAAAEHTTVKAGNNIVVTEGTNAAGGKEYTVSTAKDLNVDSVKAGDTTVNNDGLTIAGGPSVKKDGIDAGDKNITNVADGNVAAGSKDAVNGGQLYDVAKNVADLVGPDATIDPATGKVTVADPTKGIGETGKGTIGDAIKAVNDLAKKAAAEKTSVKAKDGRSNVTVTEGTNAAGGHEYTVDVERAVTEAGSDQVTVTSKHDADSNTTTYTVDVSDKTKASLAKADSAVQGLTSKDGNLNFNKDPNGNVEVSFNDNLNVKNITADGVKAGDTTINSNGIEIVNGPSMTKDGINAGSKAITNVANGNLAKGSTDAVNGGQLHDTAQSVADVIGGGATVKDGKVVAGQNGIGNTGQNTVHGAIAAINQNTANNFNQIRGDLRKMDRDLRGGIAGALATAGLPQAFRPGKSMVAAAASTYRGQSGLAIGVSRISDNGKVILKVTGNTNSRGDFGGTIGAGYQW